ncbi:MAG: AraC family transcriptional regulator, partial [Planctomycetes bacterium]|nr:AraC family transcriptional regulator [Planctomycetota bacterium]
PAAGHEVLHVVRGRMELVTADRRRRLGPGDTALVPDGTWHRDAFDTHEGLDILYCAFDWPAATRYFEQVSNDTIAALDGDRRAQWTAMFDQLRSDTRGDGQADRALLRVRLLAVLLFLLREATGRPSREPSSASRQLMLRAKQYVHAHYAECVALDDIAEALDVSGYHLSHVFSRESDFSLFAYLMQVRMDKAKELLAAGGMNVSQVSRAVGYQDPNYFSKAFRRHVGLSPRQYALRHGR